MIFHLEQAGQDGVVSVATCCGLDSLGIESWWEARLSAPI